MDKEIGPPHPKIPKRELLPEADHPTLSSSSSTEDTKLEHEVRDYDSMILFLFYTVPLNRIHALAYMELYVV